MASVRKREWTYQGQIRSAWVVTYTSADGKRPTKTFDKKKDADAYRLKVETELQSGAHVPEANTATIKVLAELYFKHMQEKVADGRIGQHHADQFQANMRKHLIPALGSVAIKNVTDTMIEAWHSKLRERLNPYTARMMVYRVKQIEDYARKRRYTALSVFKDFCKELGGFSYKPIETFNTADLLKVIQVADEWRSPMQFKPHLSTRCFVNIAAFCGLRFGEIAGLTLQHVDFANRIIRVRHSLTVLNELKGPKTKSGIRDVPMPDRVASLIKEWLERFYVPNDRNLIFLTRQNIGFTGGMLHPTWKRLLRRAGLSHGLHFHALRHFAASWMIENGLAITDVCSLLGHKTFDQTMQTYAHPVIGGNHRQEAFQRMETRLLTAPTTFA